MLGVAVTLLERGAGEGDNSPSLGESTDPSSVLGIEYLALFGFDALTKGVEVSPNRSI